MDLIIVKDGISASIESKDNEREELYSLKEVIIKVTYFTTYGFACSDECTQKLFWCFKLILIWFLSEQEVNTDEFILDILLKFFFNFGDYYLFFVEVSHFFCQLSVINYLLNFFCWFSLLIFYVFFVFLVVNSTWRLWRVGFCVFVFLSLWSVVFRKWNDNRHWRGFMKSVSPGIWLAKKKKCLVMAKKLLKPFHFFINEIVVDVFMLGNAIRMSYSVILKLSSRQSHFQS